MIPKIIHYCWFGGKPLHRKMKQYIQSWKTYCPDYKICRWDETNFDVNAWLYTRQAYQAQKFAFVSDVARLWVLVNQGGIYMDTDVEVVQSLDAILSYQAVVSFEDGKEVSAGLMACEKGFPLFNELLQSYEHRSFLRGDNTYDLIPNVKDLTQACEKWGFIHNNTQQTKKGLTLLPRDYFSPKDYETGLVYRTPRTLAVHHMRGSWLKVPLRVKIYWLLYSFLGVKTTRALQKKWKGFKQIIRRYVVK